ncbi:hypothetical protein BGZ65_012563, partial [Modicella reniformis]
MDSEDEDEEAIVTNRHRRPLLDDDDLLFSDEPRKISLTPSIARDDANSVKLQSPPDKAMKLREDESSNTTSIRTGGMSSQNQRQHQSASGGLSPGPESEEANRQQMQKRVQEQTDTRLTVVLGEAASQGSGIKSPSKEDNEQPAETVKKPGKFKSLFGVGKGSKEKEKERKEKERLEKERQKNSTSAKASSSSGGISVSSNNNGNNGNDSGAFRARANSNGSVASFGVNSQSTPLSPTFPQNENGDSPQDLIALRVYPGNVDFGASMYKSVVVSPTTMASEVANQAVVKFKLAPDGVASTPDFYLTVRGVDG